MRQRRKRDEKPFDVQRLGVGIQDIDVGDAREGADPSSRLDSDLPVLWNRRSCHSISCR